MTTNQTIDGVPRELLERILSYTWFPDGTVGVFDLRLTDREKLRALLDAPIPFPGYPPVPEDRKLPAAQPQGDTVNVSAYWSDWSMVTLEIDGRHRTYVEHGKSQGEPVVWLDPQSGRKANTISATLKRHNESKGGAPAAASALYTVPLYAHPPAPVVVMLPARADARNGSHDHQGGWNACLDEVTRLNSKSR